MTHSEWIDVLETPGAAWDEMPVTLEEAKAHLRVDHDDEDDLIELYLKAAIRFVERFIGFPLIEREFTQRWDCWPGRILTLRWGGCDIESVEVTYYDSENELQMLDPENYFVGTSGSLTRIQVEHGVTLPTLYNRINAIEVSYTAVMPEVPEDVQNAILLLVGDMYEKRTDTVKRFPSAVTWLLEQYRILPY